MPDTHTNKVPADASDSAATDESSENARDGARKRRDPNEAVSVVGIGASAGGIAPLQQFFAEMAPDSGLAFVVVMHLSPDFESQLAEVLQQKTTMPVVQVTEAVKVQPNHVYVIPPNHQLTFEDSMLRLMPPQQAQGRRVTIDLFFRTLAYAYGQRAVSIVMSGTDSDGVIGLKHIRAQGGVTIAQVPEEAEFDSMPLNAINTGMVDWVLSVADMPGRLLKFVRNENRMELPPEIHDSEMADEKVKEAPGGETVSDETRDPADEDALRLVLKHVQAHTGQDFNHYKRATVLRRIARRMQVNSIESIPRYLDFLRQHAAEARALLHDLLIGVTHFFRDQASFAALEANIPQLFAGKKHGDELRVWVTGCSTGEEAYSIAMLLCEHAEKLSEPPSLQVFATDLDDQAIQQARDGVYPLTIEADVSQERLRQFFIRDNGKYRVKKDIRDKVLFANHNVLSDPAFSRVDLVTCRNLLIYLNREAQMRVFDVFHFALRPGGLLFIGGAESADGAHSLFSALDNHHRIYVRRSIPRPTWKIPALPTRVPAPDRRPMLQGMTTEAVEDAGEHSQSSTFEGQQRRSVMFGELHLKLLEEYGPPSVVVNEAHDIVHLSETAGRYLTFRAGEPSTNLMTVVHPALRVELRTALFRAAQSKESVTVPAQRVPIGGGTETINLQVRPIRPGDSAQGFFLVLFDRQIEPLTTAEKSAEREMVSRQVGDELQSLKEQLNATVEQFEVSTEELKASNEELQAMNEELRSAAEELETSKEELQSVNEELITVNHELKEKVEELSRANSDLNNLMTSTDLATIFLDRQLRVVRFTPRVVDTFNLLPADVGRPISDITHKLRYDNLMPDAERVLERLAVIEREIETDDARTFLARISPYRTLDDKISGVVLTLVDVTQVKRVEAELRESEAKFRIFSDTAPALIWFNDAEGNNQYVNQRYLEFTGKTAQEISGKRWQLILHPDDRDEVIATYEAAQREQRPYQHVTRARRADGEWRWIESYAQPLFDNNGVYLGHVGVSPDITDRKNAEAAGQASEERVRTIADNVPQLIWTNDGEGIANYFNKRWFNYTGLSYEESYGPGWQAVVHPDDAPAAIERWQRAFAKGEVFDAEYRLRGANGEYRWFLGRNVPLRENGAVLSWFGSATDIEEHKQSQASLREAQEKFRLLVEGAPDYAMFLLDTENNITYWSLGAEQVFGWSADEAIGKRGSMIFVEEDLAKGEDRKEIVTAIREGSAPDRRWHVRKDGTRLWLDGFMRRLDHDDGTLRGFAKIAREATEQKMAEEKLREAHDELEQRVNARTKELQAMNETLEQEMTQRHKLEREILQVTERERANISQDLHDSLCQELTATAFLLKSQAKALGRTDPEAGEALTQGAEMVNRNAGLARDLARGLHPLDLGTGGLVSALRELASRTSETVSCRCECPRSLRIPNENVAVNLYRIAQEAVTNALKHGKPSEVVICVERLGDELHLVITDNGNPTRRKNKGGLGIQMMQYRASVCGGSLKVDSKPGKGTKVSCRVPAKQ